MGTCIIIELLILVCLAWMDRLPHFIANVAAGFVAITVFGVIVTGHDLLSADLLVYVLVGLFTSTGASILWLGVRYVCHAIENPREALEALDTVLMQNAVAKRLARDEKDRYSYGNRRAAEEIVRKLKERNDDK